MNLILFEPDELGAPLPLKDPRAQHLLSVLRRQPGDHFDAGIINGPRGKGRLRSIGAESLLLDFSPSETPPPLAPIHLLVGLPRPQTARKILHETSSLGVARIDFVVTEKTEAGYAQSTLWSSGEWRRHVISGTEQAFCTRLPEISWDRSLSEILTGQSPLGTRIALDNYEASCAFGSLKTLEPPLVLAFGAERGWSDKERQALRASGFTIAHLGSRVLRAETAITAAVALTLARLGRM